MKKIVLSIALLGSLAMAQTNYTFIPSGKVSTYSGDTDKDYAISAGIYFSGQENSYETIIGAEGKRVVYKNESLNDRIFYSGGWFEEYIYHKIKNELKLTNNQIAMKVKIANRNTKNEYRRRIGQCN